MLFTWALGRPRTEGGGIDGPCADKHSSGSSVASLLKSASVEIAVTESSDTLHHQGVIINGLDEPIEEHHHRNSHPNSATSHHSQEQRAQLIPSSRPYGQLS